MSKSSIKVLDAHREEVVMNFIDDWSKGEVRVEPVFNRTGIYYDRITKKSWIEMILKGERVAFEYGADHFLYRLSIHDSSVQLNKEYIDLIARLLNISILPPTLSKRLKLFYYKAQNMVFLKEQSMETRRVLKDFYKTEV